MTATSIAIESSGVADLLGGVSTFASDVSTSDAMQAALREGFPFSTFETVRSLLELPSAELAELLGVSSRTLARRKTARQLSPIESDRLYRVAYIIFMASQILGSVEKARGWLHKNNRALDRQAPIGLLDTEIGERRVEELLQRINYGIHS